MLKSVIVLDGDECFLIEYHRLMLRGGARMDRLSYIEKLERWRTSPRRKPLILEGARQVGKTWLMREFASSHYSNQVYVRFDKDRQLKRIFERDFDIGRIVHDLEIAFRTRIDPLNTVLLFDEIQACRNALTSLKYFCEDRPDLHVIAAGSLLGLEYMDDEDFKADAEGDVETTGFPVGKVDTIGVHPLSFVEFLYALGESALAEEICKRNWDTIEMFRERLVDLLKHYYVIGGMPEAVSAYVETRNFIDAIEVQKAILSGYRKDFAKHAPKNDVPRINLFWDAIPSQLAKENKKFMYSRIKKGERSSSYRSPISWLSGAGLIYLCRRVTVPRLPIKSYVDAAFKVYVLDVGLLSSMSGLDSRVVLDGSRVFTEFKGALTEQYIHQQMIAEYGDEPCYWSTDDSRTEVDFIVQKGMDVAPVEVKAEENVQSKSLKSYMERFKPPVSYRLSMLPYKEQRIASPGNPERLLVNIPLYGIR